MCPARVAQNYGVRACKFWAFPAVLEAERQAVLVEQDRRPAVNRALDISTASIPCEDQRNLLPGEGQRCRCSRLICIPDCPPEALARLQEVQSPSTQCWLRSPSMSLRSQA